MNSPDWKEIICRGAESDELDYKAAQNWHTLSRAGKAKFVRHCLAMANTKGGYVVVGVGEDSAGRPVDRTGLTEEQSASFDPTAVGNFVNAFADPAIDFTIERPIVDGRRYAVFAIRRFSALPHVCANSCEGELQTGVIYIRTHDASSRPAYRSSELHAVIQRALRNQRELLGRMIRGVLYEEHAQPAGRSADNHSEEELLHSRNFFRKHLPKTLNGAPTLEFSAVPARYREDRYPFAALKSAVAESFVLYPKLMFYTPSDVGDAYFTNVSLRHMNAEQTRLFQLYRSGVLHLMMLSPLAGADSLDFDKLILFTAQAFGFIGRLYAVLGENEDLFRITLDLTGTENLRLTGNGEGFVCRIPEISVKLERSASDLASGTAAHAARFAVSVCERFNCTGLREPELEDRIQKLLR